MNRLTAPRLYLLVIPLILIVIALCYHHTIHYPFVNWDDYNLVRDNEYNKSFDWEHLKQLLNPFVTGSVKIVRDFSHAIDFLIWGDNTLGFHLGNLFFYALTSILVFSLLRQLLRDDLAAVFGVLLFIVHPLHVESVTWLSARKEALGATFFLLALLIYIRWARPGSSRRALYWSLALLCYLVALFAKETAVVLPAIICLYEAAFGDRTSRDIGFLRRCRPVIPFFVLGLAFTGFVIYISRWINVLKPFHGGEAPTHFLSALVGPFTGIRLLFAPVDLSARYANVHLHDFWSFPIILALLCLLGMAYVAWDNWKHSRIYSFSIGWFFITLAPVSNLVPISTMVADRYLFLPSIGFCLLLAYLLKNLVAHARTAQSGAKLLYPLIALFPVVLLLLGQMSYKRNFIWQDNYSLWGSVTRQDPLNILGHVAFGNVSLERQDYDRAILEFRKTLWLNPKVNEAYVGLGNTYLKLGNWDQAIYYYNYALSDTAQDTRFHIIMGEFFQEKGLAREAEAHFLEAIRMDSLNVTAHLGMVDSYARRGKIDVALIGYDSLTARKLLPKKTRIEKNIGLAYFKKGDSEQAINWYRLAAERDSADAEIQLGIGRAYEQLAEPALAETAYRQALILKPDYIEVLVNLGAIRYHQNDPAGAIEYYNQALAVAPGNSNVLNNLAMAHVQAGDDVAALEILTGLAAADTMYAPALINLAAILIENGETSEALVKLARAAGIDPANSTIQFNTAFCHALLGDIDSAFKSFLDCLRNGFDDAVEIADFLSLEAIQKEERFEKVWEQSRPADTP